jgi:DNA-binding transcriptional MerR regulator
MMSPVEARPLRIGEVAERLGTTPRTIRYYEEIGLLPPREGRATGKHRLYEEADLDRLAEIMQLKELLGVSLDELRELMAAEDARAALRERWHATEDAGERRRILVEALGHVDRQLALVAARRAELERFAAELHARRDRLEGRLAELEG